MDPRRVPGREGNGWWGQWSRRRGTIFDSRSLDSQIPIDLRGIQP